MSKLRVAIYCRVAGPDYTGTAMFMQNHGLHVYAEEQGHDIVAVIQEYDSGRLTDRPGLQQLYHLAAQRKIDMVITRSSARICRDLPGLFAFVNMLGDHGVKLQTPMHTITPDLFLPAQK